MWVRTTVGCFVNLDHVAYVKSVPSGWALYSPPLRDDPVGRLLGITRTDLEMLLDVLGEPIEDESPTKELTA